MRLSINLTKCVAVAAVALTLTLGGVGQAKAGFIQNTTGIANPTETITFDEHILPSDSILSTQYSDLGVTFSNGFKYDPQEGSGFPHIDNSNAGNFLPIVNPVSIFFNQDETGAAFALVTNPGNSTITALENGVVVDSATVATDTSQQNNFFGFTGETFNQIEINAGGINNAFLIDNLQLGAPAAAAAPAPSSLILLGVGFVGLLGCAGLRRRLAAKVVPAA